MTDFSCFQWLLFYFFPGVQLSSQLIWFLEFLKNRGKRNKSRCFEWGFPMEYIMWWSFYTKLQVLHFKVCHFCMIQLIHHCVEFGMLKGEMHKKAYEHIWLHFFCFFWLLSFFPLVPPWKLWKKSCLKKLKVCEVSENPKSSICWEFH